MKRFPKLVSVVLIAAMLLAILSACTGTPTATTPPAATAAGNQGAAATTAPTAAPAAATAAPVAEEPAVITYWHAMDASKVSPIYSDYAEAPLFQWIMEETNTKIEFEHPPVGEEQNRFGLMVASRDLTDIIERDFTNTSYYPGGADKAIEDGVIIALNDLIDEGKFPALMAYFDKHPDWVKHWVSDSGNYVAVPFIREDPLLWTSWGPQVRLDWLEQINLGYGMDNYPDTIADWEIVMKAFKEQGLSETPFYMHNFDGWGDNGIMVGAWDVGWEWYRDRAGQLQYGPLQPEFRAYIEKMVEWVEAGYVDPDWQVSQNEEQRRAKIMGGEVGFWHVNVGGGIGYFYDTINASNGTNTVPLNPDTFRCHAIPMPTLEEGQKSRFGGSALPVAGMNCFISTAAKDLDAVARFLDFGYTEAGDTMYNFGKEGVNFDYINYKDFDVPVDISAFGDKFPRWRQDVVYKAPDGQPLAVTLSRYVRSHSSGPFAQDVGYILQFLPYHDQLDSVNTWVQSSDFTGQLLPRMYFTAEESEKMASIETDMRTFKNETLTGFLNGSKPLNDATWTEFQNSLKSMKVDEVLEIRRAAFARAEAR